MRLTYAVAIVPEADGKGYYAVVPSLPGCFSQGETVEAAERNVAEAITLHVRAREQIELPAPAAEAPGRQGARSEHTRTYVSDEQRRRPGWIGGRNGKVICERALRGLRRSRRPVPQEIRSVYQTVVSVVA